MISIILGKSIYDRINASPQVTEKIIFLIFRKSSIPKRLCNVEGCKSIVENLPRHLVECHGIAENLAKYELSRRGERKTTAKKSRPLRQCPIAVCASVNRNMSRHLTVVHKVIDAYDHTRLLKSATFFIPEGQERCNEEIVTTRPARPAVQQQDTPNCIADDIISRFRAYAISIDGNLLPKTAQQDINQLKLIMNVLNAGEDYSKLFERQSIRDKFLDKYCKEFNNGKGYKAKTKQKYLTSLNHFYQFVLVEKVELGVSATDIVGMTKTIEAWSKGMNSQVEEEKIEREMEEFESLLTAEHIERVRASEDFQEAERLFGSSRNKGSFSHSEFTLLRDYLIFELDLLSCQRSGAVANCLTENIQNAKFKSGKYIIKVKDHKTKRTHGPANFCADRDLYNNLVFFVNYVRPSVTPVNDFLFVTLSGQSMSSGQISTQLHFFVKRCNGYGDAIPPRRVCANIMRKSASTLTIQERKDDSACVASLQTHSHKLKNAADQKGGPGREKKIL